MNLTLPEQVYLCTYAFQKKKFPSALIQHRGQRMRAAALAQLVIEGQAATDGSRVRQAGGTGPSDPFLASVWGELAEGPKKWMPMVHNTGHTAEGPVSDQLLAAGIIEKKGSRSLNPLAGSKFALSRTEEATAVQEALHANVTRHADPAALALAEVALPVIVLESDATMGIVLDRTERRASRDTVEAFSDRFDREIPGLRSALTNSVLANRAVGGGWG
ncbi:GPP34 family phosphoprotein [Streptomyces sp. NPDC049916]|uniref:GPP34 family phosphoprotein n=1 Tax=Streptomyces sp. NPDC049916 TaxID=3155156 RepID=UPI00342F9B82